jgi:hypothetical protein
MSYIVGQKVRFFPRGGIRDPFANDALVDPTVTFKITSPSAATTTYVYPTDVQLVKESAGKYHVDFVLNAAGTWKWKWEASGTYVWVDDGVETVVAALIT